MCSFYLRWSRFGSGQESRIKGVVVVIIISSHRIGRVDVARVTRIEATIAVRVHISGVKVGTPSKHLSRA